MNGEKRRNTKGQCVFHLLNKPPKVAQGFLIKHQENSWAPGGNEGGLGQLSWSCAGSLLPASFQNWGFTAGKCTWRSGGDEGEAWGVFSGLQAWRGFCSCCSVYWFFKFYCRWGVILLLFKGAWGEILSKARCSQSCWFNTTFILVTILVEKEKKF